MGAPFTDDSQALHRYYTSCTSSRTVFAGRITQSQSRFKERLGLANGLTRAGYLLAIIDNR